MVVSDRIPGTTLSCNHPTTTMAEYDRTIHLPDADCDVTLSFLYGDAVAIDDATNACVKVDTNTQERSFDGTLLSVRRDAMLGHIPKRWTMVDASGAPVPLTLDAIKKLSYGDGRALEKAVGALFLEASEVHVEDSPKGES